MVEKLEITINVIVHATEDISKIFEMFEDAFGLTDEDFDIQKTTGHFDNPITVLNANLVKKQAANFIEKFKELASKEQLEEMINSIEERTIDSRYHIRIGKQELINGKIDFNEKDSIKLKIHTPIYNKKDTVNVFSKIFQIAN